MTERVWIGLTNIERAWRAGEFGYMPNALAAAARQGRDVEQAPGEAPQSGAESATPNPSNPIHPTQYEDD